MSDTPREPTDLTASIATVANGAPVGVSRLTAPDHTLESGSRLSAAALDRLRASLEEMVARPTIRATRDEMDAWLAGNGLRPTNPPPFPADADEATERELNAYRARRGSIISDTFWESPAWVETATADERGMHFTFGQGERTTTIPWNAAQRRNWHVEYVSPNVTAPMHHYDQWGTYHVTIEPHTTPWYEVAPPETAEQVAEREARERQAELDKRLEEISTFYGTQDMGHDGERVILKVDVDEVIMTDMSGAQLGEAFEDVEDALDTVTEKGYYVCDWYLVDSQRNW